MNNRLKWLPGIAALSAASLCPALTVNIPASKDNTLYESTAGNLSNGAGDNFFCGRTAQASAYRRRGLIAFDLSAYIPAGSLINSASLTLYDSKGGNGSGTTVTLYRLNRAWTEGTSNAANNEGQGIAVTGSGATWTHATYTSAPWASPGAAGTTDRSFTLSASLSIGTAASAYTWTGLRNDVQAWVKTPSSNQGWILLGNESTASTAVRFNSRTNPATATRPVLTVDYSPISPALSVQTVRLESGDILLTGTGQTGWQYDVEVSDDLQQWASQGMATLAANGDITYTDTTASAVSRRAYRLRTVLP
ncbi:MAG TPA: DNRLRE domain-containing protein [Verrucomicrobiales bacterium]|nr:DNRLRE domain-containing protein [Verrucomicrobiales bacterium]